MADTPVPTIITLNLYDPEDIINHAEFNKPIEISAKAG